jgi:glycosyltransferase involved in cell wall biosynthesis
MIKISLVINTYNEETMVEDCIKSALPFVDEVIVVDMYSTDKTVDYARGLGAKVYFFEHTGIVEPARNFALQQATSEWILLLDADERIPATLGNLLQHYVQENSYDSFSIPRKNIQFKKWVQHTNWWPDNQIRFFKKDSVVWNSAIHSTPQLKQNHYTLPPKEEYAILHYNFRSVDHLLEKIYRYTSYEKKLSRESLKNGDVFLAYFEKEFGQRFINGKGYKDEIHGFMLSKFMEFYKFVELARYWEENDYAELTDMKKIKKIMWKRHKRTLLDKILRRKK